MENQLEARNPRVRLPKIKIGRRSVIITCAVLLIAAAVVLNFVLFGDKWLGGNTTEAGTDTAQPTETVETPADSADGYFSATQVSRQRARDEAIEVLQGVVDSDSADEATKTGALMEISALAAAMEAEANIETLVTAKGFAQCVAVINGDSCSVVVSADTLQPSQIAQINEIVYEQAGIRPVNVHIITK